MAKSTKTIFDGMRVPLTSAPKPSNPYLGDVYIAPSEAGKLLSAVTDFEIWDGARWIHAEQSMRELFPITERRI